MLRFVTNETLLRTRAKSAQNFGSKSKFYVFKIKIQKYPLKKSQKDQK